ncbi:Glutamine transport ATP-binding protein GlnQ [Fundidesulfovibrio magnetotacticus]|uniref:Glutamine transport ATP-binding protein GlnQ n=1 Tax=Fundidesulfovibrio magnetotacticus TaxID=2730080 RepID=A0A6V8LRD5_9BACT|nr:ABC transporter ATP-binding protein [Fundidesulfovibrio magnetotacticus]GFK94274.1 Glutamine transport ATP-binding protein GlnQ [Fundidesulfovibrio magnetotacticus]
MLSLRGVAKFYGDRMVFKNIDLTVDPGRTLMVVGANGAGKSTLLRLMAGLSRPTAGEVSTTLAKAETAYLGHQTFLYAEATALENLSFWTGLHGLGLCEADLLAALERVGLARFAHERAGHFSRGMAQRLNLARVFCIAPRLLFLDEPDTGLDEASRGVLHAEIARTSQQGRSVVWVSHHLERDLPKADDVLFLEKGRAAYLGPVAGFDASVLSRSAAC